MSEQSGRGEPGADRAQNGRPRQGNPGADLLSDLQRWLIRSSAKSMRKEIEGQVRRTLGGNRQDRSDVWDVATTEIPPTVGEAPECQWCPICRAARLMRESGPGLAGQLSGAGDAVAAAVQDAIRGFDAFLARSGSGTGAGTPEGEAGAAVVPGGRPPGTPDSPGDGGEVPAGEGRADDARPADGGADAGAPPSQHDVGPADAPPFPPDPLAGDHRPGGWKPGDRPATAGTVAADPWATATTPGDASGDGTETGRSAGPDGQGHGPSNRS